MRLFDGMRGRIIPENVLQGKRILGFKPRNFAEGIVSALITALLIRQISFVNKVSLIIIICVGLAVFFLNAWGIKGQSITQVISHFIKYRKCIKQYSYRRLDNGTRKIKPIIVNGKVRTVSENRAKENIKKFIGK